MQFDRRTLLKSTAAVGGAALFPTVGAARSPPQKLDDRLDTDAGPQEIVVVFTTNEAVDQLQHVSLSEGYHRFQTLPMGYTVATGEQIERISRLQSVRRVVPNYELEWFNDDARTVTNAESVATELGYDGTHGHVAVIDTGLDGLHPDHQINVAHNYKYTNPLDRGTMWVDAGKADTDGNGHGTHVSGSVAGDGSVERANRGMAPKATLTMYSTGAALLVVNALGAYDHLIARKEAGRTNVQAVNNSFGAITGSGQNMDPANPDIVASYHAFQAGILPCIAAGNCGPQGGVTCTRTGDNTLGNTAQAPWVLGVAATRDDGNVAGFSSRGRPPSSDQIHNYDRELALSNYREYVRSLQPPSPADRTTVTELSGSGVLANFLVQTADTFTVGERSAGELGVAEIDGYYVETTLTWTPSSGAGAPEPSEFEFLLLDDAGNQVAKAGTNYVDKVRNEAELVIGTYLPTPGDTATYTLEVQCSRGGGQYQVTGSVDAVDSDDGVPEPRRPYGIERPSVGAPGNSIVSTMMIGDQLADHTNGIYYQAISGTSMATPVTAGVVALVNDAYYTEFGEYPDVLEVVDVVEATARFQSEKNHTVHNIGKGLVDAEAAVTEILARGRAERESGGTAQTPPTVDSFEATEAGNPSAHAEISADWTVSDGDLDAVVVEVVDESGSVVRERTNAVSGTTASGTDEFEIRAANDEEFEVVLTVTDARGKQATASQIVSE